MTDTFSINDAYVCHGPLGHTISWRNATAHDVTVLVNEGIPDIVVPPDEVVVFVATSEGWRLVPMEKLEAMS